MRKIGVCLLVVCALPLAAQKSSRKSKTPEAAAAPAPQKMDQAYTAKIKEYTTEPFFLTELVDHLPASDTVPSPEKILGHIVGAPNKLTYVKDINAYMRDLEKASRRLKVFSIGKSEEGREMILVAVSDEDHIANLDRYRDITARLADPRRTPQAEADKLIAEGLPMYWASGSIHSPETGSPEMLMELAYRLAVEESPLIQNIRKNSIVLITPVVETDGRDLEVDVYNYRKENPGKPAPPLVYWGKYVAHDNNRDGIGMALALSRNMMGAFLEFHPTVLHDLHESVPFLYVSTGMGPYNAWLDPLTIDEWQKMAYVDVEELTKRGIPGVWTHGYYDGWAPNYMFYVANGHNSIGRFYETFGAGGADTGERTVPATSTSRTWYRPNPPLPRVNWSLRNNINLQESGILIAMNGVATNRVQYLSNFYLKSVRSVKKAVNEGPVAWVIPGDDPRPGNAADLVNLLRTQAVEVHRLNAAAEVPVNGDKKEKFPAGSYVVRMDQPYSRMADMLLDVQYYNVTDPAPYDDTGWTMGPTHNVATVRVTRPEILSAPMTLLTEPALPRGGVSGSSTAAAYLIAHNADNILATLRFKLKDIKMFAAEAAFKAEGRDYNPGSFIIKADGNPGDLRARLESAASATGVTVTAAASVPSVAMHELAVPRIAIVHTWTNTQNDGWIRIAFDRTEIPYDYISDQKLKDISDLRSRYDVILFSPVGGTAQRIVNGSAGRGGPPIPFKKSALTPNLGDAPDQTDDTRGAMELQGLMNVAKFIENGGLFITITGNASIPIDYGLVEGVTIQQTPDLQARGSIVESIVADKLSPIAYGYGDRLAVYFNQGPVFSVAAGGFGGRGGAGGRGGRGGRGGATADNEGRARPTGRGGPTDEDTPQGRPLNMASPARGEATAGEDSQQEEIGGGGGRGGRGAALPPELRPRIILRFAPDNELFVSGMLAGGRELAGAPTVVDVPRGKGHVLMFANNPMWRSETQGSYFLIFNAALNYDHLSAGLQSAPAGRGGRRSTSDR
jgi:hypothetical protein